MWTSIAFYAYHALTAIGICAVLVIIAWLKMRNKTNETNKRAEILLAALEKNADIDTDAITKMMAETTKENSVKITLLNRLLAGCILAFIGIALIVVMIVGPLPEDAANGLLTGGIVFLAIGIALLLNYFVGKRFLAKEIEREENNLPEKE